MEQLLLQRLQVSSQGWETTSCTTSKSRTSGAVHTTQLVEKNPQGVKDPASAMAALDMLQVKKVEQRPWKTLQGALPTDSARAITFPREDPGASVGSSVIYSPPRQGRAALPLTGTTAAGGADAALFSESAQDASAVAPVQLASEKEREVFDLVNRVRQNPTAMIPVLEERLTHLCGKTFWFGHRPAYMSREGRSAYLEAIAFLREQAPCEPISRLSEGLCLAARDLAVDTGRRGLSGHVGSDDSDLRARLERYGSWKGAVYEDAAYGMSEPEDIVLQLIVDDGFPTRFHRKNLFRPELAGMGVSISGHLSYRFVCVVVYATQFTELPVAELRQMQTWMAQHLKRHLICPGCRKEVAETEGVFACSNKWHPNCCVCATCKSTLTSYVNHGGLPYCQQCYDVTLRARCVRCQQPPSVSAGHIDGSPFCGRCFQEELKRQRREHFSL
eukprot:RCo014628